MCVYEYHFQDFICICIHTHSCVCVCVCVCACVFLYTYTYVYILKAADSIQINRNIDTHTRIYK